MRTKDTLILMHLNEIERLERRFVITLLSEFRIVPPSTIDAHYQAVRERVAMVRLTIREVPDGA